ncbi:Tn3 family transposase [Nocardia sp. 2TAF39]|uniref:Tn3 family transposase n=1 Tax=unclassified Nocardia TaxID=2637762 RepID=UPI003F9B2939
MGRCGARSTPRNTSPIRTIGANLAPAQQGESLHALRRDLLYAHEGMIRARHLDGQTEQAWCLTLAMNAVIAWTTEYYGLAVEQMRRTGRRIDDDVLAHISPAHSENINSSARSRSTSMPNSPSWGRPATDRYESATLFSDHPSLRPAQLRTRCNTDYHVFEAGYLTGCTATSPPAVQGDCAVGDRWSC